MGRESPAHTLQTSALINEAYLRLVDQHAISPDGKWIACQNSVNAAGGPPDIVIAPFEGREPVKRLTVPRADLASLQNFNALKWEVNGRSVLYVNTQGRTSNIWSLPIDGSAPKQLTDFRSEYLFGFDLSADGKQLAFVRGSYLSDVALMSGFDK